MTRSLMIAAAFQLALGTAAFACDGQVGASIFEDNFADDSGGWDMSSSNVTITPPAMLIEMNKDLSTASSMNLTFNANDGDYCMDVVFPPPVAGNVLRAGIQFWSYDASNLFLFLVNDDASASLYKKVNGTWNAIFAGEKLEGFGNAPGTPHSILVQAKHGVLTLSVDGAPVKTIRAQMPNGPLQFGVYAEAAEAVDPPVTIQISGFSVTTGQ